MFAVSVVCVTTGCGAFTPYSSHRTSTQQVALRETFDRSDAIPARWLVVAPEAPDAALTIDNGAARLMMSTSGDFTLRRRLDIVSYRGKRLRIVARVRTDSSRVTAQLTFSQRGTTPKYSDLTKTRPVAEAAWRKAEAVVDVDPESTQAELALVAHGRGSAWFDDVVVEVLGASSSPAAAALTSWQLDSLAALARVVTLIRHRHPSDQAVGLDWNIFLPEAVGRVLQSPTPASLLAALRELFAPIAPTVTFGTERDGRSASPPRGRGTHLARWHHFGFGTEPPYAMWRDGRGPDLAVLQLTVPLEVPDLERCKKARLTAVGRRVGSGDAMAFAAVELPGIARKQVNLELGDELREVAVDLDIAADAYRVRLGVKVVGDAGLALQSLQFSCTDGSTTRIDPSQATWQPVGWHELHTVGREPCAATTCLAVARKPLDTEFASARDMLDLEINPGIWMRMPLAVWADNHQTYPVIEPAERDARFGMTDLETRLAAIVSAWGVAQLFYPYFADQRIDWPSELRPALSEAAAASSAREAHVAVWRLLAKLRDNHANAKHPSLPIDGILPVAFRRFGDALVVVGAPGEYAKSLPIGTQILSIDGIPALRAYDGTRAHVSAATPASLEAFTPFWLAAGPVGTLSTLQVRHPDGRTADIVLPRLARSTYDALVREPRPPFGAELSSRIYYINLEETKDEQWQSILPSLGDARAIILDLRGYPSLVTSTILSHFIDRPIHSPLWHLPVLESGDYHRARWEIRPTRPRLRAHLLVLVDARAMSRGETFVQIVHDNHLAILIGEPSGGTNGNIAEAILPGGFTMRFTAMRVPLADGTAIQGKGIVPDRVIHPTLEGMRTGRDEILAAALAFAEKLTSPNPP
jgi:hypothetical protein